MTEGEPSAQKQARSRSRRLQLVPNRAPDIREPSASDVAKAAIETAAIIEPQESADAVEKALRHAALTVWGTYSARQKLPRRSEVSKYMRRLSSATYELSILVDSDHFQHLRRYYDWSYQRVLDLQSDLMRISVTSHAFAGEVGGGGRKRAEPPGRSLLEYEPEIVCALAKREAWHAGHGRYPGQTNLRAHRAAASLYRITGEANDSTTRGRDSVIRDYFRAAKALPPSLSRLMRLIMQLEG